MKNPKKNSLPIPVPRNIIQYFAGNVILMGTYGIKKKSNMVSTDSEMIKALKVKKSSFQKVLVFMVRWYVVYGLKGLGNRP